MDEIGMTIPSPSKKELRFRFILLSVFLAFVSSSFHGKSGYSSTLIKLGGCPRVMASPGLASSVFLQMPSCGHCSGRTWSRIMLADRLLSSCWCSSLMSSMPRYKIWRVPQNSHLWAPCPRLLDWMVSLSSFSLYHPKPMDDVGLASNCPYFCLVHVELVLLAVTRCGVTFWIRSVICDAIPSRLKAVSVSMRGRWLPILFHCMHHRYCWGVNHYCRSLRWEYLFHFIYGSFF